MTPTSPSSMHDVPAIGLMQAAVHTITRQALASCQRADFGSSTSAAGNHARYAERRDNLRQTGFPSRLRARLPTSKSSTSGLFVKFLRGTGKCTCAVREGIDV